MLLYAGTEIRGYFHEGTSDYLLVTFSELHHERLGEGHYFLKQLVTTADISCVGVINTVKGFYLSPEMDEIYRLVDKARGGRKVIVFGQSMGGYGAIKHSARLKADYVIACSPFYSLDEDELEFPSERHRKILLHSLAHHDVAQRSEFKGMGIKEADSGGRVITLYDPSDFVDLFDSSLLRKHLPKAEFVTVPHAGHEIYNASWSPDMFSRLMLAVRSEDLTAVSREVTRMRRSNMQFIVRSLRKAAYHKPALCLTAFHSKRVVESPHFKTVLSDPMNMLLIYRLFITGSRQKALRHFSFIARQVLQLNPGQMEVDDGPLIETTLGRRLCLLMSFHGTFLAYDMTTRLVCLERNVFSGGDKVPIFAQTMAGVSTFYIRSEAHEVPIAFDGTVAALSAPGLVPAGDHSVAVRSGDHYLSVSHAGRLEATSMVGQQERFVPLPMPERSSVLKAGSINWFDQVMLTQPPAPPLFSAEQLAPRPRRSLRWRRLFSNA